MGGGIIVCADNVIVCVELPILKKNTHHQIKVCLPAPRHLPHRLHSLLITELRFIKSKATVAKIYSAAGELVLFNFSTFRMRQRFG